LALIPSCDGEGLSVVIGREAKKQIREAEGKLPDYLIALSAAAAMHGLFMSSWTDAVKMIASSRRRSIAAGEHAAGLQEARSACSRNKSYLLQDDDGNVLGTIPCQQASTMRLSALSMRS